MKVELNPEVHTDLLAIVEHYFDSDEAELAADFYAEFRRYADEVALRPESFLIFVKTYRRVNLSRFPYHFLFRKVDSDTVRILVVKHDSRDPKFGINRR